MFKRRREEQDGRAPGEPEVEGFRDLELIGQGGFGQVYRGYQRHLDRVAALKIIRIGEADGDERRRFDRECAVTGKLSSHPHVVTVFETGFTRRGEPFIAMEYFERGSLADILKQTGTFQVAEATDIGIKIAHALEVAHGAGVIHRDIKPHNILMSQYGEPALADFGIASVTEGRSPTVDSVSLTPAHAPPEVLEGKPATVRSDIYSIGSTLYTLLAGRAPFDADEHEGVLPRLLRIMEQPVPTIPRADVPPELQSVLVKAMAKSPEERFGSAADLADALRDVQRLRGTETAPIRAAAAPAPPTPARPATRAGQEMLPSEDDLGGMTESRADVLARPKDAPKEQKGPGRRGRLLAIVATTVVALGAGWLGVGKLTDGHVDDKDGTTTPTSIPAGAAVAAEALPTELRVSDLVNSVVLTWVNRSDYLVVVQAWQPGNPPGTVDRVSSGGVGSTGTTTLRRIDPAAPYCFRIGVTVIGSAGPERRYTPAQPGGHPAATSWVCRSSVPVPEATPPPA